MGSASSIPASAEQHDDRQHHHRLSHHTVPTLDRTALATAPHPSAAPTASTGLTLAFCCNDDAFIDTIGSPAVVDVRPTMGNRHDYHGRRSVGRRHVERETPHARDVDVGLGANYSQHRHSHSTTKRNGGLRSPQDVKRQLENERDHPLQPHQQRETGRIAHSPDRSDRSSSLAASGQLGDVWVSRARDGTPKARDPLRHRTPRPHTSAGEAATGNSVPRPHDAHDHIILPQLILTTPTRAFPAAESTPVSVFEPSSVAGGTNLDPPRAGEISGAGRGRGDRLDGGGLFAPAPLPPLSGSVGDSHDLPPLLPQAQSPRLSSDIFSATAAASPADEGSRRSGFGAVALDRVSGGLLHSFDGNGVGGHAGEVTIGRFPTAQSHHHHHNRFSPRPIFPQRPSSSAAASVASPRFAVELFTSVGSSVRNGYVVQSRSGYGLSSIDLNSGRFGPQHHDDDHHHHHQQHRRFVGAAAATTASASGQAAASCSSGPSSPRRGTVAAPFPSAAGAFGILTSGPPPGVASGRGTASDAGPKRDHTPDRTTGPWRHQHHHHHQHHRQALSVKVDGDASVLFSASTAAETAAAAALAAGKSVRGRAEGGGGGAVVGGVIHSGRGESGAIVDSFASAATATPVEDGGSVLACRGSSLHEGSRGSSTRRNASPSGSGSVRRHRLRVATSPEATRDSRALPLLLTLGNSNHNEGRSPTNNHSDIPESTSTTTEHGVASHTARSALALHLPGTAAADYSGSSYNHSDRGGTDAACGGSGGGNSATLCNSTKGVAGSIAPLSVFTSRVEGPVSDHAFGSKAHTVGSPRAQLRLSQMNIRSIDATQAPETDSAAQPNSTISYSTGSPRRGSATVERLPIAPPIHAATAGLHDYSFPPSPTATSTAGSRSGSSSNSSERSPAPFSADAAGLLTAGGGGVTHQNVAYSATPTATIPAASEPNETSSPRERPRIRFGDHAGGAREENVPTNPLGISEVTAAHTMSNGSSVPPRRSISTIDNNAVRHHRHTSSSRAHAAAAAARTRNLLAPAVRVAGASFENWQDVFHIPGLLPGATLSSMTAASISEPPTPKGATVMHSDRRLHARRCATKDFDNPGGAGDAGSNSLNPWPRVTTGAAATAMIAAPTVVAVPTASNELPAGPPTVSSVAATTHVSSVVDDVSAPLDAAGSTHRANMTATALASSEFMQERGLIRPNPLRIPSTSIRVSSSSVTSTMPTTNVVVSPSSTQLVGSQSLLASHAPHLLLHPRTPSLLLLRPTSFSLGRRRAQSGPGDSSPLRATNASSSADHEANFGGIGAGDSSFRGLGVTPVGVATPTALSTPTTAGPRAAKTPLLGSPSRVQSDATPSGLSAVGSLSMTTNHKRVLSAVASPPSGGVGITSSPATGGSSTTAVSSSTTGTATTTTSATDATAAAGGSRGEATPPRDFGNVADAAPGLHAAAFPRVTDSNSVVSSSVKAKSPPGVAATPTKDGTRPFQHHRLSVGGDGRRDDLDRFATASPPSPVQRSPRHGSKYPETPSPRVESRRLSAGSQQRRHTAKFVLHDDGVTASGQSGRDTDGGGSTQGELQQANGDKHDDVPQRVVVAAVASAPPQLARPIVVPMRRLSSPNGVGVGGINHRRSKTNASPPLRVSEVGGGGGGSFGSENSVEKDCDGSPPQRRQSLLMFPTLI